MTFVQVKDHEWLDILEGILLRVEDAPSTGYGARLEIFWYLRHSADKAKYELFLFPTLAEALTAAEKIIGSCEEKSKATEVGEVFDQHYSHGFNAGFSSATTIKEGL